MSLWSCCSYTHIGCIERKSILSIFQIESILEWLFPKEVGVCFQQIRHVLVGGGEETSKKGGVARRGRTLGHDWFHLLYLLV